MVVINDLINVRVKFPLTEVILTQGVSLRTNLNIDSTKLAGVDSTQVSSDFTTHSCNISMSLNKKKILIQPMVHSPQKDPMTKIYV